MTVYEIYFNIASTENMICIYNNNFLQKTGILSGSNIESTPIYDKKQKTKKLL